MKKWKWNSENTRNYVNFLMNARVQSLMRWWTIFFLIYFSLSIHPNIYELISQIYFLNILNFIYWLYSFDQITFFFQLLLLSLCILFHLSKIYYYYSQMKWFQWITFVTHTLILGIENYYIFCNTNKTKPTHNLMIHTLIWYEMRNRAKWAYTWATESNSNAQTECVCVRVVRNVTQCAMQSE